MRTKLQWASGIATAASMVTALLTAGSGAWAEENTPVIVLDTVQTRYVSNPVIQDLSAEPTHGDDTSSPEGQDSVGDRPDTLAAFVDEQPDGNALDQQMRCLAGAIYFEARGESLDGQLAVGRVIVERENSNRFPDSYCGVVFQRSQFSFVRGSRMPAIRESSAAWRRAVAVARIADQGSWDSPAEGALFFHAARVSPGWGLTRLARIDNHIFYR